MANKNERQSASLSWSKKATIILTMESVPMDNIRTRANVPLTTEGGKGVVSRRGTRCYTSLTHKLARPGVPVCQSPEVPSVTNVAALRQFRSPLNIQLAQRWCCGITPKLFRFVDRVVDLHRVTLKAFLFGFESSDAKPAYSLQYLNNYIVRE